VVHRDRIRFDQRHRERVHAVQIVHSVSAARFGAVDLEISLEA
jgi:hypothetical protein